MDTDQGVSAVWKKWPSKTVIFYTQNRNPLNCDIFFWTQIKGCPLCGKKAELGGNHFRARCVWHLCLAVRARLHFRAHEFSYYSAAIAIAPISAASYPSAVGRIFTSCIWANVYFRMLLCIPGMSQFRDAATPPPMITASGSRILV